MLPCPRASPLFGRSNLAAAVGVLEFQNLFEEFVLGVVVSFIHSLAASLQTHRIVFRVQACVGLLTQQISSMRLLRSAKHTTTAAHHLRYYLLAALGFRAFLALHRSGRKNRVKYVPALHVSHLWQIKIA